MNRIDLIQELSKNPQNIFNICIVAHIDHGKTSLTDSLISSNMIFSKKMNGQMLYMDFREDEQERQITMKSSSISLLTPKNVTENDEKYVVNVIDSPGHMDFEFEVKSGLSLTDGVILVVDVVEGVSSQTIHLLKQVVDNGLVVTLFLNKIDKLFQVAGYDAYKVTQKLDNIIESLNAIISGFLRQQIRNNKQSKEQRTDSYFDPLFQNVTFGSVLDGWGFWAQELSEFYAKKWQMKAEKLSQYFYGDFYLNLKEKKMSKKAFFQEQRTIFTQYSFYPIERLYYFAYENNCEKIQEYGNILGTNLSMEEIKTNPNQAIKTILSNWMPIERSIFRMIIQKTLSSDKNRFWQQIDEYYIDTTNQDKNQPIVIVSKFLQTRTNGNSKYIALARILKGNLINGQKVNFKTFKGEDQTITIEQLYLWQGSNPIKIQDAQEGQIIGFESQDLQVFKAGQISSPNIKPFIDQETDQCLLKVKLKSENIVFQVQLEDSLRMLNKIDPACDVYQNEKGEYILKVCGEIHLQRCLKDLESLYFGHKVNVSDIIVDFRETINKKNYCLITEDNETIYQNYIKENEEEQSDSAEEEETNQKEQAPQIENIYEEDSKFKFKKIEQVYKDIRETSKKVIKKQKQVKIKKNDLKEQQFQKKEIIVQLFNEQKVMVVFQAISMPEQIRNFLQKNEKVIGEYFIKEQQNDINDFVQELIILIKNSQIASLTQSLIIYHLDCFGPKLIGPNMFINLIKSPQDCLMKKILQQNINQVLTHQQEEDYLLYIQQEQLSEVDNYQLLTEIQIALQQALLQGPLCQEQIEGTIIFLERIYIQQDSSNNKIDIQDYFIDNQINIFLPIKQAIEKLIIQSQPRIMESTYLITAFCSEKNQRYFIDVVKQKQGKIIEMEFNTDYNKMQINALIPIHESQGFYQQVLKASSGDIIPTFSIGGWEVLEDDPFWDEKMSESDKETHGEIINKKNKAKQLIEVIREKKGLCTFQKIVEDASKQSTLSKAT